MVASNFFASREEPDGEESVSDMLGSHSTANLVSLPLVKVPKWIESETNLFVVFSLDAINGAKELGINKVGNKYSIIFFHKI